jgi:PilZ domain
MTAPPGRYQGTRDRRRFHRVRLNVMGRYLLTNGREYVCRTRDMSPVGLALIAPALGRIGERVIAYLEHFGRLEGRIVRSFSIGFVINIAATKYKRDKIAIELTRLVDQQNLPEIIDS